MTADKEYGLTIRSPAPTEALAALAAGPTLEDGKMLPPKLEKVRQHGPTTTLRLTIHEGRNRIIRRACVAAGLDLISLRRTRIGSVALGDLPEGAFRNLSESELEALG